MNLRREVNGEKRKGKGVINKKMKNEKWKRIGWESERLEEER